MDQKKLLFFAIALNLIVLFLILKIYLDFSFSEGKIYKVCLPVPTVVNNTYGEISYICSYPFRSGVYVNNIPIKDRYFQYSIEFARLASCTVDLNSCNKGFLLDIDSNSLRVSGPSGSLAMALEFLSLSRNSKVNDNCSITGFVLPSGLLVPIGGLKEKEEGSFQHGFKCILAPNEFNNVTSVGDLIEAYNLISTDKINTNILEVPKGYKDIIKEISEEICANITKNKNISEAVEEGYYYSAASLCYGEHLKHNVNISKEEILDKINSLETELNNIDCSDYNCREIKYQVQSRLLEARKNIENRTLAYWRYKTAEGWFKFLRLHFDRKISRELVFSKLNVLLAFSSDLGLDFNETNNYFEAKETIAKIEMGVALLYYKDKELLLSRVQNLTEKYLSLYGFSVTSYNYLEYSKYLEKIGDLNSAIYYAFLALEYSQP